MLVRHHLDLGRLAEAVDRHYLAVIVEWCDASDLSGPYVDETIRVDQSVVVADIERPACRDRLDVGVESAIGVVQLESALQRKRFAAPDVGNPHDGPADTGSGERDVSLDDRVSAHALIDGGTDDRRHGSRSVEIDGTGDRPAANHRDNPIGLTRWGDD